MLDLDDAFEIDETDGGSISGEFHDGEVVDNFDEGRDFDEEGNGDITATVTDTLLDGNVDEGIKGSEEGDGSVDGVTRGITADADENDIEYEEADNGRLPVSLFVLDSDGIEAEQTGTRSGIVRVRRSTYEDTDLDGVTLR